MIASRPSTLARAPACAPLDGADHRSLSRDRAGVDRDDAAGGQHVADLLEPARSISAASAARAREAPDRVRQVRVGVGDARRRLDAAQARGERAERPGQAAEQRHDAVEPQPRRSSDSGGRVGVGDLEHDDAAARAHDAHHLRQAAAEVVEVARAEADRRGVEASRRRRAAPARPPIRSAGARAPGALAGRLRARAVEHRLGEVAADDLAAGADAARELERQVAGAGGDVEHAICRARRARARPRARASGGAGRPSSPCSSGRRRPRCGRTSRAPGPPRSVPACVRWVRRLVAAGIAGLLQLREEVDDRLELLRRQVLERRHRRGRVDERARDRLAREPRARCASGSGPGPALPLSPILWQARQPDCATTALAGFVFGERRAARLHDARRRRHFDRRRRARVGALVGQERHRADHRRCPSASRPGGARDGARGRGRRTAAGTAGSCRSSARRSSPAARGSAA